jgi:transcriptional regulator with XRE-family HTH domain
VDNRAEVREFLTSRRAKITPEQAGLPEVGQRRVPGLRRSEVAALAQMSVEYYAKLERGSLGGVSAGVLDAIARALQLDETERAHLFHLAHAADGTRSAMRPRRRSPKQWTVRPSLQWTLDSISTAPAIVGNSRMDLLATNHLGRVLYSDVYNDPNNPPNFARIAFLDNAARRFYPDWNLAADSSPDRWRPGPRPRKPRPQSRTRTHHDHLRCRTKLTNRTRPRPPRILGSHPRHRHRNPADLVQATTDPSDCMLRAEIISLCAIDIVRFPMKPIVHDTRDIINR